ncbi:MFS transporter [Nocardia sp. NPDC004568]|uniref:MFS transporter n=1 Tax=Nocardia sp. NPDC004568 TaxID=3154551 RepID=UPI0033B3ECC6
MSVHEPGSVRGPSEEAASDAAPAPRRWMILGLLAVAQLMLILDITVVALALPHIQTDLELSREALTWTVSAYTLAFGGLILLGGRLADVVGAKPMVLAGLTVFTLASLGVGLAENGTVLLGARIGQGIGAAILSPAALSLVVILFSGTDRNKALGVWSALGGAGAALGVLLGGFLVAGFGWSWVFFINVPIGFAIIAALTRMLPRTPGNSARLDVLGAVLATASSTVLVYALITAGDHGWITVRTGVLLITAALGYTAFAVRQRRARTPLISLALLTRRSVRTGIVLIFTATALMIAVFFLGTFYFQHARGYSALTSGLLFLPVALATMAGADLTGRALAGVGIRPLAVGGLILATTGMAIPALSLHPLAVVTGIAIAAAGTGALFVVASATTLSQVEPAEAGIASGVLSTFHEFGASFGAAAVSSVAAAAITGSDFDGFGGGFVLAAAAALTAAVLTALLTRPGASDKA